MKVANGCGPGLAWSDRCKRMNVYILSAYALIRSINLYVLMLAAFLIFYDVWATCIAMLRKLHVRITREIMIPRRVCLLLL